MVVAEICYLEKSKPHLYSSQMTEAQNALTQMEEQKSERLRSYERKQSPLITVEQCAPSGSEIPSWQVKEEPAKKQSTVQYTSTGFRSTNSSMKTTQRQQ